MAGIRKDVCPGPRAAAYCLGAVITMLVGTMEVYAQHPHATQHPHITQHPHLGCPPGLGHLPHHAHHCPPSSTPFHYESPYRNDYQHWMHDIDTQPPTDPRYLQSQIEQVMQVEKNVIRETQRIIDYQRELQKQIQAQISQRTGRKLSGPNKTLEVRRTTEPGVKAPAQKHSMGFFKITDAIVVQRSRLRSATATPEPQTTPKDSTQNQDAQNQDALNEQAHKVKQAEPSAQSPRRAPRRRPLAFEDVVRALAR